VSSEQIFEIFKAPTDWEFILKIDALLEAAVKRVVKQALVGASMDSDQIDEFVDSLPMRGRTSLLRLLRASGCEAQELNLIEAVRIVRNGFAHDITQMELPLIEVLKRRKDKSSLLKNLCWIKNYDEAELIEMYVKDGSMFRFGILTGTFIFMIVAYHAVIKESEDATSSDSSELR
jgi:hypothetical protein